MWTDERDGGFDEDESGPRYVTSGDGPYVDGAWGRTANPNTADGELQNLAAFGAGLARLSGPRRTAAKLVVWLLLIGVGLTVLFGVVAIVHMW